MYMLQYTCTYIVCTSLSTTVYVDVYNVFITQFYFFSLSHLRVAVIPCVSQHHEGNRNMREVTVKETLMLLSMAEGMYV